MKSREEKGYVCVCERERDRILETKGNLQGE
jgi:hypothetical protein